MTMPSAPLKDSVLPEALAIAQPLVSWLIRSGVGYAEFAAALKPVFLAQAQQELAHENNKLSDSALSLRSGLHRKDVRALREFAALSLAQVKSNGTQWSKPSLSNQVVTRWLSDSQYPDSLPLNGAHPSFESLARATSKDVHPRSLRQEMTRLGVIHEIEGEVHLVRTAFVPDPKHQEARQLMAGSVADHLQAGVHNLGQKSSRKFLEQSVFADGLSEESMHKLNLLANDLWAHVLQQVVQAATPLCEQDVHTAHPHRFRMGLFSYGELESKQPLEGPNT